MRIFNAERPEEIGIRVGCLTETFGTRIYPTPHLNRLQLARRPSPTSGPHPRRLRRASRPSPINGEGSFLDGGGKRGFDTPKLHGLLNPRVLTVKGFQQEIATLREHSASSLGFDPERAQGVTPKSTATQPPVPPLDL
jgi:hypothetical protein